MWYSHQRSIHEFMVFPQGVLIRGSKILTIEASINLVSSAKTLRSLMLGKKTAVVVHWLFRVNAFVIACEHRMGRCPEENMDCCVTILLSYVVNEYVSLCIMNEHVFTVGNFCGLRFKDRECIHRSKMANWLKPSTIFRKNCLTTRSFGNSGISATFLLPHKVYHLCALWRSLVSQGKGIGGSQSLAHFWNSLR